MSDPAETLARRLESIGNGHLVVVTGAGISLASGIPTFRGTDPGAIWQRDVTELGTRRFFESDPAASWSWYASRFDIVLEKEPNRAHQALAALERWHVARSGRFLLVTQNVDPLHERAGSERLIKVHGTADRVRCTRHGCEHGAPGGSIARADIDMATFVREPTLENLPRCPACGSLLRQHVLWFDEYYDEHDDYQWGRVLLAAQTLDCLIFVGTSLSVGVTDLFLGAAIETDRPVLAIDPGAARPPHPGIAMLRAPSEEVLPEACARLDIEVPGER